MTTIIAVIRIVHNAAVTLLATSFGFMVASLGARNMAGFVSWADGLGTTYIWTFFLALGLYALLAVLLVGYGAVHLVASPAGAAMKHYVWPWLLFSCVLIAATNYRLGLDLGHHAGFDIGGPLNATLPPKPPVRYRTAPVVAVPSDLLRKLSDFRALTTALESS